jgi:rhodanese-related sulfurtransferase
MRHWKAMLATLALLSALGLWIVGLPGLQDRMDATAPEVNRKLASRSVQIDPAELLDLVYNANFGIRILDFRPESEYNLFHVLDAKRVTLDQVRDPDWIRSLPTQTAFILVSNGEEVATQAFRIMAAWNVPNLYILEGGVNHWIEVFGPGRMIPQGACGKTECRRYSFDAALGDRQPESDPDVESIAHRAYQKKVVPIGRAAKKAGGCG